MVCRVRAVSTATRCAVVTAVLNLDTAVVFLTPIVIHAARQRDCDERPFLYGTLFMANGASLLLPGSNLTNLIVLAHEDFAGAVFLVPVFPVCGCYFLGFYGKGGVEDVDLARPAVVFGDRVVDRRFRRDHRLDV